MKEIYERFCEGLNQIQASVKVTSQSFCYYSFGKRNKLL